MGVKQHQTATLHKQTIVTLIVWTTGYMHSTLPTLENYVQRGQHTFDYLLREAKPNDEIAFELQQLLSQVQNALQEELRAEASSLWVSPGS
jgi:hypothetical protein